MVRIREMLQSDVVDVVGIEAQLFTDGWSETSLISSLEQPNVKMIVATMANNDEVIGYHIFYTSIDEGDVARIAVVPKMRRMGVGDQLLDHMWEYCKKEKIARVLLEVRKSNESAIRLYEKHGFISLGMRKGYYQNPLEDGLIMEKHLDITTRN